MTLNLATQPFVNRRRFYTLSGLALGVLSVTLVIVLSIFIRNFRNEVGIRKQMKTVRQEIARLDEEQQRVETVLKRPESADILDRNDFLNTLIRQKAVSWTRLFMDLEKVMPDRVQALSLHPILQIPGMESGKNVSTIPASYDGPLVMQLQLQVAGESVESLLKMVRQMENAPFTTPVLIVQQPKLDLMGQGAPVAIVKDKDDLYNLGLRVTYVQ
jgi:Tfp pilus assembly protein PilN